MSSNKICYFCDRSIQNGKKNIRNGIKYVCKNEEDIKICNKITEEKNKLKRAKNFNQEQLELQNVGVPLHTCNNCKKTFYPNIILETYPEQTECPFCKSYCAYKYK